LMTTIEIIFGDGTAMKMGDDCCHWLSLNWIALMFFNDYYFCIVWNDIETETRDRRPFGRIRSSVGRSSVGPPGTLNLAGCWRTAITACCFPSSCGHTTWRPWQTTGQCKTDRSLPYLLLIPLTFWFFLLFHSYLY
jgi:hypothetical protein